MAKQTARASITPSDIKKFHELDVQIKALEEQKAELRARLLDAFDPDKYEVEVDGQKFNVDITLVRGAINEKLFTRDFPSAKYPDLYLLKPDSKAVLGELEDDALPYFGQTTRLSIKVAG